MKFVSTYSGVHSFMIASVYSLVALWHNCNVKTSMKILVNTIVLVFIGCISYFVVVQIQNRIPAREQIVGHSVVSNVKSDSKFVSGDGSPSYTTKFEKAKQMLGSRQVTTKYVVVVDISEQKDYIFTKDGKLSKTYRVSTGGGRTADGRFVEDGRTMDQSVWKVVSKRNMVPTTTIYGPKLMNLDRLENGTWITTNVALHGTNDEESIGLPISLGCVYHKNADIIELFGMLEMGTLVVMID